MQNNYLLNSKIYGDAIIETSKQGIGNTSWYNDYSNFPLFTNPFFLRGGRGQKGGEKSGIFTFFYTEGNASYGDTFRCTLI